MTKEYISRDATRSDVLKWADGYSYIEIPTETAIAQINAIPAADVAPVRHGRWIKDGEDGPVYCSECGEEHEWGDYRASYCDTCGAKMDGGQDDGPAQA